MMVYFSSSFYSINIVWVDISNHFIVFSFSKDVVGSCNFQVFVFGILNTDLFRPFLFRHVFISGFDRGVVVAQSAQKGMMHFVGIDFLTHALQGFCGTGVADNGAVVSEVLGGSYGGIDTHVGHHSTDDQMLYVVCFKQMGQLGFAETIGEILCDHRFAFNGEYIPVDLRSRRVWNKEGGIGTGGVVLNVDDGE